MNNQDPKKFFRMPQSGQPNSDEPRRVVVDPNDTQGVVCPCGCQVFTQGLLLRKISIILGGDGMPRPMPIMYCVKCFKPVPEFLPPGFALDVDVESTIVEQAAPPVKPKTDTQSTTDAT